MADDRSHAIKFHLMPNSLQISSQAADEGEARETVAIGYGGEEVQIGFNAAYLQDFFSVVGDGAVAFEFKDANSQAQLRPLAETEHDYRYIVMPMRL